MDETTTNGFGLNGDPKPLRQWIPGIHQRACAHAHKLLGKWKGVDRPDTASLVDRAICELLTWGEAQCDSREHAVRMLVQKMRQVLADLARSLTAKKRGGAGRDPGEADHTHRVRMDADRVIDGGSVDDSLLPGLDEALERLETFSPRLKRVFELRYIVGLSIEETAQETNVSPATVKRDALLAKAWLMSAVDGTASDNPGADR